ncbi:hypothetical protein HPB47_015240 [Ixodes persulcatus]|uniref:Uncharacterized protein n=1 Tax=Ixodes persulcatus TaxID=34615 RepID=A0AC60QU50_IXOPE|nr:hypothetical protein HPB47_015240 [Ixodes persulcatus]
MAADEDIELRDLLLETLEKRGVINKIKAELRANVYLALEEQESVKERLTDSSKDVSLRLSSDQGRLAASLVRDFLESIGLRFTLSVLSSEAPFEPLDRAELCTRLNLADSAPDQPVLMQLVSLPERSTVVSKAAESPARAEAGDGIAVSVRDTTYVAGVAPNLDVGLGASRDQESSLRAGDRLLDLPEVPRGTKGSSLPSLLPPLGTKRPPPPEQPLPQGQTEDEGHPSLQSAGSGSRSEHRGEGSVSEDSVEEEVEEGSSNADDLLNSSLSLGDDRTVDQSISKSSEVEGCDYVEKFH